jgi:5-methylcytosine-specific restriction endonuclease McrA
MAEHITTIGKPKVSTGRPELKVGQKWNFLLILAEAGRDRHGGRLVRCRCDCGNEKDAQAYHIRAGRIVSCGCYPRQMRRGKKLGYWRKSRKGAKTPEEAARRSLFTHYTSKARQFQRSFELTEQEFFALTLKPCCYCGSPPKRLFHRDKRAVTVCQCLFNGIDRIDSAKGYSRNNVVPCCWKCNTAKNSMSQADFASWIKAVHAHWALKVNQASDRLLPQLSNPAPALGDKT